MCRDNIPTVRLQQFDLDAEFLDDDDMRGIKPSLYADSPGDAEAALLANPDQARRDVMRLQRIFFAPESISGIAAIQVEPEEKFLKKFCF